MMRAILFLWRATRGNRLTPWRSPYLCWRMETYTGKRAETITVGDFWRLAAADWRQMIRFLRWTGEMGAYAEAKRD